MLYVIVIWKGFLGRFVGEDFSYIFFERVSFNLRKGIYYIYKLGCY